MKREREAKRGRQTLSDRDGKKERKKERERERKGQTEEHRCLRLKQ